MVNWFKHLIWKNITQDPQYDEVQVPCPEISLEGISQELYSKLLEQATEGGAVFEGTKAEIHGCNFDWNYDASSQILNITCLKKPFYASCPEVESKIRELVEKARVGL